jgi:hypothetical protein
MPRRQLNQQITGVGWRARVTFGRQHDCCVDWQKKIIGVTFDWGANAAVLFGRQRAEIHHHTTNIYHSGGSFTPVKHTIYQTSASPDRNRQMTVPNLGGFAGVSWRYPNAKVSVGYRADFFFGATDGASMRHIVKMSASMARSRALALE